MDYIGGFLLAFYIVAVLVTCIHIKPYKGGEDI